MLVLSRKKSETFKIGDDIEIMVVDIRGDKIRIGINAPDELAITRPENEHRVAKRESSFLWQPGDKLRMRWQDELIESEIAETCRTRRGFPAYRMRLPHVDVNAKKLFISQEALLQNNDRPEQPAEGADD